uniref:Uncharacterized protein n=1 Tax=Anguilla anguilla TaxID=7936 RepID=A0A0E9RNL0_ANGAN
MITLYREPKFHTILIQVDVLQLSTVSLSHLLTLSAQLTFSFLLEV